MIGEKKESTPIHELCQDIPAEFGDWLQYVRNLGFYEAPDYEFLDSLLVQILSNAGETEDGQYDWA